MISRIRHLLFDNLVLKISSFIIAFLMWYGVAHDPVSEVSLQVPVEFARAPKDLDYTSDVIPQAQVRLRGPARDLRDLQQENVHAIIDLQGAVTGEHTYDLDTAHIHVPHGIEVMQVTPNRLHLVFDSHISRQVPVIPRVVGILPPGMHIDSVTASPAELTISGPARHVNAVERAVTDAVDVTGVSGKASFQTAAYLPDPLVHIASKGPVRVLVVTSQKSPTKDGLQ
ncbi:MAG: CdaR family protein [Acidobacteriota bacterium]|nr:CdaR family protein [Acidobacteriota bacterium]